MGSSGSRHILKGYNRKKVFLMLVVLYRDALAYVDKKFKTQYFKTKLHYVNLPGSSPAEIQQLARIGSSSELTGCKSFAESFSKPSAENNCHSDPCYICPVLHHGAVVLKLRDSVSISISRAMKLRAKHHWLDGAVFKEIQLHPLLGRQSTSTIIKSSCINDNSYAVRQNDSPTWFFIPTHW